MYHSGKEIMVWGMFNYELGGVDLTLIESTGRLNGSKYLDILKDSSLMDTKTFSKKNNVF
jgi:hypothetical protein